MNNIYEQEIALARQDYNRQGGVEPINGNIQVPWRTKKDLAIWLLYLAYVFPMKASRRKYTHEQIADLVEEEWGMSRKTYFNYLQVIRDRGWMIPAQVMTQWEQSCYMNGAAWQLKQEQRCAIVP